MTVDRSDRYTHELDGEAISKIVFKSILKRELRDYNLQMLQYRGERLKINVPREQLRSQS